LGFRVRSEPDILDKERFTAGSDKRRTDELMRAFADREVKAIWAARGGYGVMRLLDRLDEEVLGANPKILIGYSDITALHLYLYKRLGWVTFHGPMAAKDLAAGEDAYDRPTLVAALTTRSPMGQISRDISGGQVLHRGKTPAGTGRLLGGCLSIISALMGTPDELDTRGSILFLEDTATKPFAIERMLTQLRLAGKFSDVRGIVFGEMIDCVQHPNQGYRIQDVLADFTADLGVPVIFGLPSGHSPRGNLTLPLGVIATLDGANGILSIDESAVM
ncbi:MAG: LD-carboxypeptidase, partial [Acidobacteriota bacterium]